MRKIIGKTIHFGLIGAKRSLSKSPRLKQLFKRVVYTQLGIGTVNQDKYGKWLQDNFPDFIEISKLRKKLAELTYKPRISVVVPVYNTRPEFLKDCIESVLGQIYENWELCIVDDASPNRDVQDIIKSYGTQDKRIVYKLLKQNRHISDATNEAVKLASGEFIALFDHDDMLWPNALFEVAKALNQNKDHDFVYTDEDKITENRHEHLGPHFKPDWNPDFLHSVNYITHLAVIRKTLFDKLGGLRAEYNGAQDWDLFLRVASATKHIHHIPKILYSWRIHDESTAKTTDSKPYVVAAQKKAIEDDLKRKGYDNYKVQQDKKHRGYWDVRYALKEHPKISIVIPSKNQFKIIKKCVESIYAKTTYKNFEIVLVDTGSNDKRVLSWYKKIQSRYDNFKLINWPEQPFSYARSCNEGAHQATGELLVMLNNDTEVITPDWLEILAGDAQREDIGVVGCLLFFPDKFHIQHAGVGVGLGGVAANSFSMMTLEQPMTQTQHLMIHTKHDMTAVTAACMMLRKSVFDAVGGFDEAFRVTYNDVDLCLRIYDKGYQNLYTPHVRLLHHESISVGMPSEIKKRDTTEFRAAKKLFGKRWVAYVQHDPNINANLCKQDSFYDLPPQS